MVAATDAHRPSDSHSVIERAAASRATACAATRASCNRTSWRIAQRNTQRTSDPEVVLNATTFAIAGEPFGVARIELSLPPSTYEHQLIPVLLHAEPGRIFYPSIRDIQAPPRRNPERDIVPPGQPAIGGGRLFRRVGELIRQVTAEPGELPIASREVMFLFKGNEPLTIRLNQPDAAVALNSAYNPLHRRRWCIERHC